MAADLIFLLGAILYWTGIACLAAAIIQSIRRAVMGSGGSAKSALILAGIGALSIFASSYMTLQPEAKPLRLPVVWVILPLPGIIMLAALGYLVFRLYRWAIQTGDTERTLSGFSLSIAVSVFLGSIIRWYRFGESAQILKGSISLSPAQAVGLLAFAALAFVLFGMSLKSRRAGQITKGFAIHGTLILGSALFGAPFFWLLLTSFKEDQDMASTHGMIWVPKVSETAPYFHPRDVMVSGQYQGQTVEGLLVEKYPDGSGKVDIVKPGALRGLTFTAPAPLKVVPSQVPVLSTQIGGEKVEGKVIDALEDGSRKIEIMRPESKKGEIVTAKLGEYEAVRHVGLRVQNYSDAIDFLPIETNKGMVFFRNSVILVVLNVIGTLLTSSLVAYAFARLRFPGKNLLFMLLLSTLMLPTAVTMLPTFLIWRSMHAVDTLTPLWLPAFFGAAFNIFLLRQFFSGIPMELEDAAKIDGCSFLRAYWTVMLPQIKPALTVVAIWTLMGTWNNFMGPLVYINSPENMPVSYAVQLFNSDRGTEKGLLMAFSTMALAPILVIFFAAQRWFIEGVQLSGLGGR